MIYPQNEELSQGNKIGNCKVNLKIESQVMRVAGNRLHIILMCWKQIVKHEILISFD
jgi:hypothetical protein